MRTAIFSSLSIFWAISLMSCGPDLREGVAEAYAGLPPTIDYNFDVKPILSDRCFACHGPDAQQREADLRLDTEEGAYAELGSGNGVAIKPGKPASSELVRRINSLDPDVIMPTPESHLTLSVKEIAILTKWVEQGAEYKPHWAFTAPEKPEVPAAGIHWAKNPIDHFIAEKLELENVDPAPEAERPYLIRRAYFDLNGLPPSLEEIDRWVSRPDPDWYEQMVDTLMERPAYGERMATHWLDVARFADSEGYLDDLHHAMWPYRDWVIDAYNRNLPYNTFIEWQLGGDQLEDPTREQIVATAFNRNHKQNSEGGIIPEEFRVENVADRTNTVGTAFMGLTVGCARCHDHKYDPFSQQDYFQLFGFFNNTVERGDAIFGYNGIENGQMVPDSMAMNAGPTLPLPDEETKRIHDYLLKMIAAEEQRLDSLQRTAPASPPETPTPAALERYVTQHGVHHLTFDQAPVRDLAPVSDLKRNHLKTVPGKVGKAISLSGGQLVSDGTASQFERSDPFTVSFWIMAPKFYEEGHLMYNSNARTQAYKGWDVIVDSNRVHLRLNHAHPYQSIDLRIDEALEDGVWKHFVWSYDGSSDAGGMRVYVDGSQVNPTVIRNHLVRSTRPYTDSKALLYMTYGGFTIGDRHYDDDFNGGQLDEVRILNVEAGDLVARYLYEHPQGTFTVGNDRRELAEYRALHQDETLRAQRDEIRRLRRREVTTIDTVREVMVMGDDTRLRPTYILERGVYDAHGKRVEADVPQTMLPWPDDLPRNRLGLGRWLTHPAHPLTARVAVNQMWYLMFGRGIVESVEDFGNQGALPSHPALLDWLAVDFRESDWDVKRLVRMMVTSATYRQSSVVRPELAERDPSNIWLARGTRYRRSAEMIRDNALAASGLLEPRIGGASTFPYQPRGLWSETMSHSFFPGYRIDSVHGIYRRSMYTFWKRNAPPPAMMVFDASIRSECQVRRQSSSTPLQALVLLNDPQIIEACRVLASNALARTADEEAAVDDIFRMLTGRRPTEAETELVADFYDDELAYFTDNPGATREFLGTGFHATDLSAGPARVAAMARVANTVMNSTEGYYKN
ncbi:DUF1553 domain-containing protein [Lewinella sp. JB7]|uniref:DUF1553 domain-containing protein n=1 Tax=Lewinella sp. JB7 TaxID=2962887 RepID=UPI0020CA0791|nr:DUF1553 domain-containing protein [Lewinella sp. JB7]MCP9235770.1 DUF1553 domain-containing protein [Lewinella sp. JB7]